MNRHTVKTMRELGSQNFYQFPATCPVHGDERNRCSRSYGCGCHYEEVDRNIHDRHFALLSNTEVLNQGDICSIGDWSPWKADKAATLLKEPKVVDALPQERLEQIRQEVHNGEHA